jgi:hypothetical protein
MSTHICIYAHRPEPTQQYLIPALESLIQDPESVIRQHVAAQILQLAIVACIQTTTISVAEYTNNPHLPKTYIPVGYTIVLTVIVQYLTTLLSDADVDVRRSAATSWVGIAQQILPADIPTYFLEEPLRLAALQPANPGAKKRSDADAKIDELRITAANVLAELAGAASEQPPPAPSNNVSKKSKKNNAPTTKWIEERMVPAILQLCQDPSFRVRRAGVQALPRLLGACSLHTATTLLVPAFCQLSADSVHRIRKSSGECLVDMSRSCMILAANNKTTDADQAAMFQQLRRTQLIPVADRLIQDGHKMVRQGMMQFLGPFIASFYPFQYSALGDLLPASTESDGSHHTGIVAPFFPHATSMVSRLNSSSQNSVTFCPTPVHTSAQELHPPLKNATDQLYHALPLFVRAHRMSALSLAAVVAHRTLFPPDANDLRAVTEHLLDYFAALAIVTTGDENTDAEMRVYCAYSFPAVALLLGRDNWEGPLKTCFFSLLNSNYSKNEEAAEPPLPVKRCLASSLHTVARVLGPEAATTEILPVFQELFLKDPDESVRLNVIRNFPSLLEILPESDRTAPFLIWSQVVLGEEFLGARKRSATNPLVLNWRQRDYLARSLPNLLLLVGPILIKDHLWPVLKHLLADPICQVKDDAMWSIPILLKQLCAETVQRYPAVADPKRFSKENSLAVCSWLKEKVLRTGPAASNRGKMANFSDRQLYCRIIAAVGLALRFTEDLSHGLTVKNPETELSEKFKTLFGFEPEKVTDGPYQHLTDPEIEHLKQLLRDELLAPALEMKEDRISNVRVMLMRALQVMPDDIKELINVKPVLQELIEEVETWESFGLDAEAPPVQAKAAPAAAPVTKKDKTRAGASAPPPAPTTKNNGPVDVDDVVITPSNSQDEEDVDPEPEPESEYIEEKVESSSDEEPEPPEEPDVSPKLVLFEDGPIGMQLEPTREDRACRVFDFLDSDDTPSVARESGQIDIGDVIVSVNGQIVTSYDDTIGLLKKGGSRQIQFRAGTHEDDFDDVEFDQDGSYSSSSDDFSDDEDKRAKARSTDKAKVEEKKDKKVRRITAIHTQREYTVCPLTDSYLLSYH